MSAEALPAPQTPPRTAAEKAEKPGFLAQLLDFLRGLLRWLMGGTRSLVAPGGLVVVCIVIYRIGTGDARQLPPIWPLVLAAFLFLWRLAALLFDLAFVWHAYIRRSRVNQLVGDLRRVRKAGEAEPPP